MTSKDYNRVRKEIESEKEKLKGRGRGNGKERRLDQEGCKVKRSEGVRGKFEVTKFSKGREFKTKGDWFSLSDW